MNQFQTDKVGPAFSMMEAEFATPLRTLSTQLVTQALDLPPGDETAPLQTLLIFSIGIVLKMKREATLEAMGWPDFEGERAVTLKKILRQQVTRICQGG